MLPTALKESLEKWIADADHPMELAVDLMIALQKYYGYLSDEALEEGARMLDVDPLKLEEMATFYTFIYREPVGRYVIHVCDSVICWMEGYDTVRDYLSQKLGIEMGETTPDGLFTLLPVCCIGYCDMAPAILINGKVYGSLTVQKLDDILIDLKSKFQSEKRGDN